MVTSAYENKVVVSGVCVEVKPLTLTKGSRKGEVFGHAVLIATLGEKHEVFTKDAHGAFSVGAYVRVEGKLTRNGYRTGVEVLKVFDLASGKQLYPKV